MKFSDFLKKIEGYRGVCTLEKLMKHRTRVWMKKVFFFLTLLLFAFSTLSPQGVPVKLTGFFFLLLVITTVLSALDAFYYSYARTTQDAEPYLLDLASIISVTNEKDIIGGFIRSDIGMQILIRAGLQKETISKYLHSRTSFVTAQTFSGVKSNAVFSSYLLGIYGCDKGFEHLLLAHGIDASLFIGSALWVIHSNTSLREKRRWWARERLHTVPSLSRVWSFRNSHSLMRMTTPLQFSRYQGIENHGEAVERLETILTRSSHANAILIGDDGVGKMEVIESLARKAFSRNSTPELLEKEYFVLDFERLAEASIDRLTFETLFSNMLIEASRSGNVLFVIPNFSDLLLFAESFGSDLSSLMNRFLSSTTIQFVAISDTDEFFEYLQEDTVLINHFTRINVVEEYSTLAIRTLHETVHSFELQNPIVISYPSIYAVIKSGRAISEDDSLFDNTEELLRRVIGKVLNEERNIVYEEDIDELFQ